MTRIRHGYLKLFVLLLISSLFFTLLSIYRSNSAWTAAEDERHARRPVDPLDLQRD
jgi:hypothetical protein